MNSTNPYTAALVRGLISAVLVAALTFLATWQTTDEPKVLITATATVLIGQVIWRFGLEGTVDQRRSNSEGGLVAPVGSILPANPWNGGDSPSGGGRPGLDS